MWWLLVSIFSVVQLMGEHEMIRMGELAEGLGEAGLEMVID